MLIHKIRAHRVGTWLESLVYKIGAWTPIYWLRTHTIHRYHLVDLRGADGYKWGWIDRSHAMFIACFKLLEEYVEGEHPFDIIDWDSDEGHAHAAAEIKELYAWWKTGRAAHHKAVDDFYEVNTLPRQEGQVFPAFKTQEAHDKWLNDYWELDEIDQRNLERLVKIRGHLWT